MSTAVSEELAAVDEIFENLYIHFFIGPFAHAENRRIFIFFPHDVDLHLFLCHRGSPSISGREWQTARSIGLKVDEPTDTAPKCPQNFPI